MRKARAKTAPDKKKLSGRKRYERLFSAKDGSAKSLRSGYVVLARGENIGGHDSGAREEIIVVLKGKGELLLAERPGINFSENSALYVPPGTLHDVKNTGRGLLKYVFCACPARRARENQAG